LGGDELADCAEGAGEGGLRGALRLADATEQEDSEKNGSRFYNETEAVCGDARSGGEKMSKEQTGKDGRNSCSQRSER
jgi:hypothetical protein